MTYQDKSSSFAIRLNPEVVMAATKSDDPSALLEAKGQEHDAMFSTAPSEAEVKATTEYAAWAEGEVLRLTQKADSLDDYQVVHVDADQKDKSDVSVLTTGITNVALNLCIATPVAIGSVLLIESDKMSLLGTNMFLGGLFVAGSVAGGLVISFMRDTLTGDTERRKFDTRLGYSTAIAFGSFVFTLGLAATPIVFGDAGTSALGFETFTDPVNTEKGFTLTVPTSLLFLAMAVFDMCAAGMLHVKLKRRKEKNLTPVIQSNPEKDDILSNRLPGARKLAVITRQEATKLEQLFKADQATRAETIAKTKNEFNYVRGQMERAAQAAAEEILQAAYQADANPRASEQPLN